MAQSTGPAQKKTSNDNNSSGGSGNQLRMPHKETIDISTKLGVKTGKPICYYFFKDSQQLDKNTGKCYITFEPCEYEGKQLVRIEKPATEEFTSPIINAFDLNNGDGIYESTNTYYILVQKYLKPAANASS